MEVILVDPWLARLCPFRAERRGIRAMGSPVESAFRMKRLLVDYSLIGHGRKFTLTLLRRKREGLEVGSLVEIIGDGVESEIAAVTGCWRTASSSISRSVTEP